MTQNPKTGKLKVKGKQLDFSPTTRLSGKYFSVIDRWGDSLNVKFWIVHIPLGVLRASVESTGAKLPKGKRILGLAFPWEGEWALYAPNPTTPEKAYIAVHELCHLKLHRGTAGEWGSGHEYEADSCALDQMKRLGIPLTRGVYKMVKDNLESRLKMEKKAKYPSDSRAVDLIEQMKTRIKEGTRENPTYYITEHPTLAKFSGRFARPMQAKDRADATRKLQRLSNRTGKDYYMYYVPEDRDAVFRKK